MSLAEGREVEALRRMERIAGVRQRIEIRLSRASIEPGIFGMVRPVLMWPEGISRHLDDAQLDAILTHEVQHVHRHDNLAAAIHMVVEAIFWFHPLLWWLGARLVEERERACDEDVLELGSERQVYAEGILKVCEFCLASPLACMSGVAGGNLEEKDGLHHDRTHVPQVEFWTKAIAQRSRIGSGRRSHHVWTGNRNSYPRSVCGWERGRAPVGAAPRRTCLSACLKRGDVCACVEKGPAAISRGSKEGKD